MSIRRAVATVTLVGLGPGMPVWVNTDDPQIDRWIRGGQLRFVDGEPQAEVEPLTDAAIETLVSGQPESQPAVETEPQPEVEAKPRRAPARRVTK